MADKFAVIKLNSKQYVVEEGSQFKLDRLPKNPDIQVILAESEGKTYIGEPAVSEIGVKIAILEDKKDKKIAVRRFKSKSRYRKNKGHRQPVSIVRIIEIAEGLNSQFIRGEAEKPVKAETSKKPVAAAKVESKEVLINDLDLTDAQKEKLMDTGFRTASEIKKAGRDKIAEIKGFGPKAVEKLFSQV